MVRSDERTANSSQFDSAHASTHMRAFSYLINKLKSKAVADINCLRHGCRALCRTFMASFVALNFIRPTTNFILLQGTRHAIERKGGLAAKEKLLTLNKLFLCKFLDSRTKLILILSRFYLATVL